MDQDIERLAADLACPVPAMPEHRGTSSTGTLEVVPGVQYAPKIRCRDCGFEFRVTAAQARRYLRRSTIRR